MLHIPNVQSFLDSFSRSPVGAFFHFGNSRDTQRKTIFHCVFDFCEIFIRATGGIPVNRAEPAGIAESVAKRILEADRIIMVITPEGTRSRVDKWKTGFLRIAQIAQTPVVQVSWDYPTRTVQLGPEAVLTGDTEVDIAAIRAHFRQFTGRNPENQSP